MSLDHDVDGLYGRVGQTIVEGMERAVELSVEIGRIIARDELSYDQLAVETGRATPEEVADLKEVLGIMARLNILSERVELESGSTVYSRGVNFPYL